MFVIGNEGSVRNLRISGATANPDWATNRDRILKAMQAPVATGKK
jgi:hypothetical protein